MVKRKQKGTKNARYSEKIVYYFSNNQVLYVTYPLPTQNDLKMVIATFFST
jgi:hypothetical protein